MAGVLGTGRLSIARVRAVGHWTRAQARVAPIAASALALLTAALLSGTMTAGAAGAAAHASPVSTRTFAIQPAIVSLRHLPEFPSTSSAVPTYQQCVNASLLCYDPKQVRSMYGVSRLLDTGHDGKGQTIVVLDAYGSPTLRADVRAFDQAFGLMAPPALTILHPLGQPTYHESARDEANWAAETSLDVEWAHALAPGAKIDLLESRNDNNFFMDAYRLEAFAFDHHLGKLLSQSWGTAEENLTGTAPGRATINDFERLYGQMDRAGWTIFAAAGDTGSGNLRANGSVYRYPTVNFPASSPLLTAVGGTRAQAKANGQWVSEVVWNAGSGGGATGGGVSRYFPEPAYQRGIKGRSQRLLRGHRGIPDISWDADPDTGVWVRCTAAPACQSFDRHRQSEYYGWDLAGGTSAGSPQWVGLLADIDQAIGAPIGPIDSDLYRLGRRHVGFHDVIEGNNAYDGVSGFSARRGWDEASGWGSPGARLAAALIADGRRRR